MTTDPMRISPRYRDADWLALDPSKAADWDKAVAIFQDRIEGRFLKPASLVLKYRWGGFAVLALDALLVETLQQFWEGVNRTPTRVSAKGCRHLESERYFRAFLCGPLFNGGFTKRMAHLFYTTVRCGILHQAEASGTTRVRRRPPLVALNSDGRGLHLNPEAFHEELERAYSRYVALLRQPAEADRRRHFWRKMNFIAKNPASAVDAS